MNIPFIFILFLKIKFFRQSYSLIRFLIRAIKFILTEKQKQAGQDLQMNESLQRALNEVSLLKKTLNSEKTSHQNTLQQLDTTYQIIDEIKEMLKNEQDKNKLLAREIKEKNNKIDEISHEYEDQIISIKQLIQRKDQQIKKYSQIKVTDYDMIRLRVISQVQAQHTQQIQSLKNTIKKCQFLNNQAMYEIRVLRQKNSQYQKEIDQLKNSYKQKQQQMSSEHLREINKVYGLLEQEKLTRKQVERAGERQAEKNKVIVKKYHKELEVAQLELLAMQQQQQGKQNASVYANQHPTSLLQLKQSQFALQNQKLKHQLKQKTQQLYEISKKHKSQTKQLKRKIDELEKDLNDRQYEVGRLKEEVKTAKTLVEQQTAHWVRVEYERKQEQMREMQQVELAVRDREIRLLKKQLNAIKNQQPPSKPAADNTTQLQQERQKTQKLLKQNQQLKQLLKKFTIESAQFKKKAKIQQYENRQARTHSVQDVKDKLHAANAQIVNLLKDKIALNDQIAKMKLLK